MLVKKINAIRHDIKTNIKEDENWERFEENFNLVYDNFMIRLVEQFPDLKITDKKLCAYLRMGLTSKPSICSFLMMRFCIDYLPIRD